MIVVNKKIKVIVITLLILLEVASTYLMYRSFNNKNVVLDNVKLKGKNKNNGLAIMIEQEDGTYKESSSNAWPEEMMYNEEKSGCIDSSGKKIENSLTYEGGIATVNTNTTSYCYLYFDLIKDDVTIAVSTDGESGVMPSNGTYTNSATCSSGNITWSDKYQRIEIDNLTKPTKCNLAFTKDTSTKTLLRTEVESKATTNANGYRYSGKTPNNWIWFNGERWRIIGSIPVCLEASCGTNTTNLVKIIRNQSMGALSYDAKASGYTGAWGSNTLYYLLNNYYYGAKNGTETDYCYADKNVSKTNCDYINIGINPNGYYGKMIKNVYWNNGTCDAYITPSSAYDSEKTSQTIPGNIGLMSASDYGYAANNSYYSTKLASYSSATSTNWLHSQGFEFTNIKYSSNTALWIDDAGDIQRTNGSYRGYSIRPVVYLDSSVYIISGDGTQSNPYIIGM